MSYGPIVGGVLDFVAGVTDIVAKRIETRRERWSQLVAEDPGRAVLQLELAATDLELSVGALPKWRWRAARRRTTKAKILRAQAEQIRRFARHELCDAPMRRPI